MTESKGQRIICNKVESVQSDLYLPIAFKYTRIYEWNKSDSNDLHKKPLIDEVLLLLPDRLAYE